MEATATKPLAAPLTAHRNYRVNSIDLLRGLVMIIMALDHARDLLHFGALTEDPLAVQTTTPYLFFTRWITHFCAPVFVFLSGTSIYLQGLRKSKKELSVFLLKRGLWLILAEVTLVTFGITFDLTWGFIILQVIWAIGISMVLLSGFIWLPFWALVAIGAFIVLGHNSLDAGEAAQEGAVPFWYSLLHRPTAVPFGGSHLLGVFYPFLPWTGVMLLGYGLGRIYEKAPAQRNRLLAGIGVAAIIFFIVLRYTNTYGDPLLWQPQANGLRTIFSFLNTQKYPPSLLYCCMTLGPALLFLAFTERWRGPLADAITVYGRVPFFYYLLHFYFLHLIAAILFLAGGGAFAEGLKGVLGVPFKFVVPGRGLHLWQVYLVWLGVVLLLYPLCKWYGRYKARSKAWWVSYV